MDSEVVIVDITYRRRPPDSRLECLLSWLLPAKPMHEPVAGRIDVVLSEDLEVRPA